MKNLISLTMLILFSFSLVNAQTSKVSKDPAGEWKYEAPYAPEGYSSGKITVSLADKKYSAAITFSGSDYKITGENVKFVNDSLLFFVYIEGETVSVKMKMDDVSKMTGKALSSQGDIPLTATRVTK